MNLIDLAPTLLELAGAEPLPDIDGRSFRPLLEGTPQGWDNATFSEYGTRWAYSALMRMLRRDRWKFIYYDNARPSLFDLETDPDEENDLAESPAHAGVLAELQREALDGWNPAEVNSQIDLWKRRNAMIYGWFSSRPREDTDIYRAPAGANRLDAVPEWQPQEPAAWPKNIASF